MPCSPSVSALEVVPGRVPGRCGRAQVSEGASAAFGQDWAVMADETNLTSPLVARGGNWPDDSEAEELLAELFCQRAIHACFTMLPALSVIRLRDGSQAEFGSGYNVPLGTGVLRALWQADGHRD